MLCLGANPTGAKILDLWVPEKSGIKSCIILTSYGFFVEHYHDGNLFGRDGESNELQNPLESIIIGIGTELLSIAVS